MWTIEKLKNHFSMSDQQIYRRLNMTQKLLDNHIQRGDKNAIVLTEGGFRILENVIGLEKQGKTLANAVEDVKTSLEPQPQAAPAIEILRNGGGAPAQNGAKPYESQVRSLIEEVGYLKGKLELKAELLDELKAEAERLREENAALKRSVALVEYKANERRGLRWFWRSA